MLTWIVGVGIGVVLLVVGVIILTDKSKERRISSKVVGLALTALGLWIALQNLL